MANKTGLVSISFRKHGPEEILQAAADAGLELIEWGGDVHVPHGALETADQVVRLSRQYGVGIAEYGSYYIIGKSEPELFGAAAATARRLGTDTIRVWPGMNIQISQLTGRACPQMAYPIQLECVSEEDYLSMVADARRICDEEPGMTVALECHPASLTETYDLALRFLGDVGRENLKMMWQPNQMWGTGYDLEAIQALLPYIVGVHVFAWNDKAERFPLAQYESIWRTYLELLGRKELNYMLEFMPDDRLETLAGEAETLGRWIREGSYA